MNNEYGYYYHADSDILMKTNDERRYGFVQLDGLLNCYTRTGNEWHPCTVTLHYFLQYRCITYIDALKLMRGDTNHVIQTEEDSSRT
jgi:hypothetical protein